MWPTEEELSSKSRTAADMLAAMKAGRPTIGIMGGIPKPRAPWEAGYEYVGKKQDGVWVEVRPNTHYPLGKKFLGRWVNQHTNAYCYAVVEWAQYHMCFKDSITGSLIYNIEAFTPLIGDGDAEEAAPF